jgi:endonuclease/exonuclease/phosphatase family metal-dependent hydrolase
MSPFRYLALALVFLATPALAADYIILGAWNIEHLGQRTPGQAPIALAEHITLAGVDVLALEEIHDTDDDPSTYTNHVLDTVVLLLNEGGAAKWDYKLFPKKREGDTSQLTGVMWNKKRVQAEGEPFRLPMHQPDVDGEMHPWDRWATAMKFRFGDKTDIVIIPLHMKANVNGADFGMAQRGVEAKMLVDQLAAVKAKFNDQDVVLLGDTNFKPQEGPAAEVFADAGFRDLNDGDVTTYARGTGAPFDRIFVPKQPEFRFTRQYVLLSTQPEQHEEYLSDHHMVVAAIKVMDDDD